MQLNHQKFMLFLKMGKVLKRIESLKTDRAKSRWLDKYDAMAKQEAAMPMHI